MPYRRSFAVVALSLALFAPARAQSPPPSASSWPDSTPSTVVRMDSFTTLVSFFNLASGTVRIVAVLSPSSPATVEVLEAIMGALRANPSRRLRAYVVMSSVSSADTDIRALSHTVPYRERRLTYLWDPNALAASAFRSVSGPGADPATGLCMLYDTDARFLTAPAPPKVWMCADPRLHGPPLDAVRLAKEANTLVRRVEARATEPATPSP
jgi:hypothetical protein